MKRLMTISLPLGSDIMTTMRLTTGGLCSLAGLGLDDSEDCKVCVTESLLMLMHAGFAAAEVTFSREEEALYVRLAGVGERANVTPMPEDGIAEALLGALAADMLMEKDGDCVKAVSFSFSA